MPPVNNANYAWIQHFIHHLSPVGMAGVDFGYLPSASAVLAHGSISSNQSGEGNSYASIAA
jgi:type I restriction enzyme M protein